MDFAHDNIAAAFVDRGRDPFFVTGEDHLRVTSFSSLAAQVVTISGRFFDLDTGVIVPFKETHSPNSNRTSKQTLIRLGRGFVLNITARVTTGAPVYNQTYMLLEMVRGFDGPTELLATLTAGAVTATTGLSWPGSPIRSSLEGPGVLRSILGTNPAAGVEITEVVPTAARWRFHGMSAVFVSDATVTNRAPELIVDDGTTTLFLVPPDANQAQSLTVTYSAGAYGIAPMTGLNSRYWSGYQYLPLKAGWQIRTTTVNLQAGDNWGAPQLLVEEWLEV